MEIKDEALRASFGRAYLNAIVLVRNEEQWLEARHSVEGTMAMAIIILGQKLGKDTVAKCIFESLDFEKKLPDLEDNFGMITFGHALFSSTQAFSACFDKYDKVEKSFGFEKANLFDVLLKCAELLDKENAGFSQRCYDMSVDDPNKRSSSLAPNKSRIIN